MKSYLKTNQTIIATKQSKTNNFKQKEEQDRDEKECVEPGAFLLDKSSYVMRRQNTSFA